METTDHTFAVRAIDVGGLVDLTPATHTWTVEEAEVVLFTAASNGDMGGRAGADSLCADQLAAQHPDLAGLEAHAFLCFSGLDDLTTMPQAFGVPTDVPLQSETGTQIAANWDSLTDATGEADDLDSSLEGAGLIFTPNVANGYWLGCDAFLTAVNQTCTGWNNGGIGLGKMGDFSTTDGAASRPEPPTKWHGNGEVIADGCSGARDFVCVAY